MGISQCEGVGDRKQEAKWGQRAGFVVKYAVALLCLAGVVFTWVAMAEILQAVQSSKDDYKKVER